MCLAITFQGRGNNIHANLVANLQSHDRKKSKGKFELRTCGSSCFEIKYLSSLDLIVIFELNQVNCLSVGFLQCQTSISQKSDLSLLVSSEMIAADPLYLSRSLSMQLKSPPVINLVFGKKYSFRSEKKRFLSVILVGM